MYTYIIHICMYTYIYIYVYTSMQGCSKNLAGTQRRSIAEGVSSHVFLYVYIHTSGCVHICMYIYTYVCMYVYTER